MTTAPAPRPSGSFQAATASRPVQLTTFIGREREIAAVDDLLQSTRLLTLTGVGGAGKTRLAAEVAARVALRFEASGWVDLASLSDPALVPQVVAAALRYPQEGDRPAVDTKVHPRVPRTNIVVLRECGPPRRRLRVAPHTGPLDRAASPHPAGNHLLESRSSHARRGGAVSAPVRVRRDVLARRRRSDLRRRRRPRRPVVASGQIARGHGSGPGRGALSPARNAPPICAGAARPRERSCRYAALPPAVLYRAGWGAWTRRVRPRH